MAIKKLQNNFTTPEQSKRLLELGVPADSADCFRLSLGKNTSNFGMPRYCYRPYTELSMYDYSGIYTLLPCWSVGRLIEIMALCYEFELPNSGSIQVYATDIKKGIYVDVLISDIERFINKIDFLKLED